MSGSVPVRDLSTLNEQKGPGLVTGWAKETRPAGSEGIKNYLLRLALSKNTLAMLDQGVVSGISFLTTILVGRWCGAEELGVYSLGYSLLVAWACAQEALIALPYTILRHRPSWGSPAEYAGNVLVHQGLLSFLALAVLAATAAALSLGGALPGLATVTWTLAGLMPFALLRDFGRRFAFAHLRMAEALLLDMAVAVVQLAGLAWLASIGGLSAATAYGAIGLACALTGVFWLFLARDNFVIHWSQVGRRTMQQSWALGKWLFGWHITLAIQAYFIYWLLAWLLGASATGVYAACMTVALFSNPLILGIANALAPSAADAFNKGGFLGLRRVVFQTTLLLGVAMVLFCIFVLFTSETIMDLLYDGPQYQGHGQTVVVLALAMLVSALGMPASNGLMTVVRADVVFKVALAALCVSVALIPCLVVAGGLTGAAYGFLAGNLVGAAGRWLAFFVLVREDGRSSVMRVLQQFAPGSEESDWLIEPMNEGAQANIFAIRRRDRQPIWENHLELAVKVFKPIPGHPDEGVRDQFESLARLHAQLNDHNLKGWKIFVPAPVYRCEWPPALMMTVVPGRPLNSFLENAGLANETMESIADALLAALERYWLTAAKTHGDLNFDNVLCDPVAGSLSLVDPGIVENFFLCGGVPGRPAARDLAYLLYDMGVSVRRTLGNPGGRRRQRYMVEKVLRAFLKRITPDRDKQCLLDEIQACVQVYLKTLQVSWSPRGLWHRVVRRIASRRINEVLDKLRVDNPGEILKGPGQILLGVFETLERSGISYCITHGYEEYPQRIQSDVDGLIAAEISPIQLAALLHEHRAAIGAMVVRSRGYNLLLAGNNPDGSPCFVHLDFSVNYELDGRQYYAGPEVLKNRRSYRQFWVPAADLAFGCYLVRKIAKGQLDDEQGKKLTNLFQQDPAGCWKQIARFWGGPRATLIGTAAESGNWQPVKCCLGKLRTELRRRVSRRHPWKLLSNWLSRLAGRMKRGFRPDGGLEIIFLGPDGAGKSSVVREVGQSLTGAFARTTFRSFPPALLGRLHRHVPLPDTMPHASRPRSYLNSVIRAIFYWFVYATLDYYAAVHWARARSRLVMHDRHLVDALVDPRRYRYGGPSGLLWFLWRLVPKPDLVLLLDAPPEVLQARKQEVPFAETVRQREGYRLLVGSMVNGHVVDAAQPLGNVVRDVNEIVLRHLTRRTMRRLGLDRNP